MILLSIVRAYRQLCWLWWAQCGYSNWAQSSNGVPYSAFDHLDFSKWSLVGSSGVEPPTSCLSGMRSNLLSYEPVLFAQSPVSPYSEIRFLEPIWFRFFNRWWRWRDSNPWPPACRAGALPTELHPHIWGKKEKWIVKSSLHYSFFFILFSQPHSVRNVHRQNLLWQWVPENRTTTISPNFVLRRLFCFFASYEWSFFNPSCSP